MINILYETDKLFLKYEYESVELVEKQTGKIIFQDDFYGDPSCGLIDTCNNWAIVAGEYMFIWTPSKFKTFKTNDFNWIHALRIKDSENVEILLDPWSNNAAIWELKIETFNLKKIKDFNNYKNKEYTDKVIW